ncbi:ELWxxDGT repeat protein [Vitiosangium sp. GDMCC 1.1324]|uniref:ELWxxDGT repeat protein n=1 Tax=Vitiosangium sp. (strain GDMCC 1.1324) TaxID=2138576 RepID=UPI00130E274F|nr:ELWxxDGT repeat protein [Vitiosangium sp. GDMCC 1.1324]
MRTWKVIALACVVAAGCGGPLPEEAPPSDEQGPVEDFSPGDGEGGATALWNTETPMLSRARLVKDVLPDASFRGEEPMNLVEFRGRLFFTARQEDGRSQLWKSNGTEAGTVVVREFPPVDGAGFLADLTPVGRQLFFTVADAAHGRELWVSDGTAEGTRLVVDLTPGPGDSALNNLVAVGQTLFFFRTISTEPGGPGRSELWTSNGTAAGTVRVRDFGLGTSASFGPVLVRGDSLLFFVSAPESRFELWKSDGSRAGTLRLRTFEPGPQGNAPNSLRDAGRFAYFLADDSVHGNELWRTDGTAAGTALAADLTPGPASSDLQLLDVANGFLFFTEREPTGAELRLFRLGVSGSSPGAPSLVTTIPNPFPSNPEVFSFVTAFATTGTRLFFSPAFFATGPAPIAHQLWVTDGTASGTTLLHQPLSLSDEFTTELFPVDGLLLFPANDTGPANTEPWVSDGTVKGTRKLQEIQPGGFSSFPHAFTRVNGCVFFVAFRDDVGNALWVLHVRR